MRMRTVNESFGLRVAVHNRRFALYVSVYTTASNGTRDGWKRCMTFAISMRDRMDATCTIRTQAKWCWMQRLCGVSLVLLLTAVCRTEALELFPFETHQRLPQGSDESALLTLTTPLVIQQQNYSAVTVSSPGGTPPCPFICL